MNALLNTSRVLFGGKCTYCPLIKKASEVQCKITHKITKITKVPKHITCELSDIIYLITCKKCDKYYVGETGRPFRKRIYEHKLSVSKPKETRITPVSKHFTEKVILSGTCNFLCWNGVPSSTTLPNLNIER